MTTRMEFVQSLKIVGLLSICVTLLAGSFLMRAQANTQANAAVSQEGGNPLPAATFEVVSIHQDKPNPDGRGSMQIGFLPNGTFTARGLFLKRLICMAYGVDDLQVSGGPDWLTSDRYTIEAKADSTTQQELPKLAGPQMRLVGQHMVQGLLADRFQLKMHPDSKEIQILALVSSKGGPKVHESTPGDTYPNGLKDRDGHAHARMMQFDGSKVTAQGVPLDNLASLLTEQLHQIVQNKTGLKGNFDFTLEWTGEHDHDGGPPKVSGAEAEPDSTGLSIYTAIQEQLGLKLEAQKSAVPVFVIDRVERPSEN
jgi:uncharacterized protein (TIGR03435 family)